ncbi:MAG: hypothetical protein MJZ43_06815, partial [Bacteroidaceae bacterium]|nr:hypothetical protein [Bacteroidaceae bacterium]
VSQARSREHEEDVHAQDCGCARFQQPPRLNPVRIAHTARSLGFLTKFRGVSLHLFMGAGSRFACCKQDESRTGQACIRAVMQAFSFAHLITLTFGFNRFHSEKQIKPSASLAFFPLIRNFAARNNGHCACVRDENPLHGPCQKYSEHYNTT